MGILDLSPGALHEDRTHSIVEIISKRINIPISVETYNLKVMIAAVSSGAKMINGYRAH